MLGFIVAVWATPHMSITHLLFSTSTTAHIPIALQLEERDLVTCLGTACEEYRWQVSMILSFPKKSDQLIRGRAALRRPQPGSVRGA
jgi:protein-S-isoprenylcysteine O-methyltransferase Ste14